MCQSHRGEHIPWKCAKVPSWKMYTEQPGGGGLGGLRVSLGKHIWALWPCNLRIRSLEHSQATSPATTSVFRRKMLRIKQIYLQLCIHDGNTCVHGLSRLESH